MLVFFSCDQVLILGDEFNMELIDLAEKLSSNANQESLIRIENTVLRNKDDKTLNLISVTSLRNFL